jgi:NhaA family Na+:H+ antiporter
MERVSSIIGDLRRLSVESLPPLSRLEFSLGPLSSFVIVPVFALANAGVIISGETIAGTAADPVLLGVMFGLVVGKSVGVTAFAWLAIRLGLGRMPRGTTWRHMIGLSMLAGIGFTVALFVASLSLAGATLDSAKLGIFGGSLIAGVGGYLFLRLTPVSENADDGGQSAASTRRPAESVPALRPPS